MRQARPPCEARALSLIHISLYAELAAEYAGFSAQSPADIGEIVSAAMTVTQAGEARTQTVASPADLTLSLIHI